MVPAGLFRVVHPYMLPSLFNFSCLVQLNMGLFPHDSLALQLPYSFLEFCSFSPFFLYFLLLDPQFIFQCNCLSKTGSIHPHNHGALIVSQHRLQLFDFVSILLQQGVLRVFVDDWLVLDKFGSAGIPKCRQCLVVVVVCWRYISNHDSLGVSSEAVL